MYAILFNMKVTPNLQRAAQSLRTNVIDIFELAYLNNPVSLVHSLRQNRLTTMVMPNNKEIEAIVKRLILLKDAETMRRVLKGFSYNSASNNPSSNSDLWAALGFNPGDFTGLFNKAINNK